MLIEPQGKLIKSQRFLLLPFFLTIRSKKNTIIVVKFFDPGQKRLILKITVSIPFQHSVQPAPQHIFCDLSLKFLRQRGMHFLLSLIVDRCSAACYHAVKTNLCHLLWYKYSAPAGAQKNLVSGSLRFFQSFYGTVRNLVCIVVQLSAIYVIK